MSFQEQAGVLAGCTREACLSQRLHALFTALTRYASAGEKIHRSVPLQPPVKKTTPDPCKTARGNAKTWGCKGRAGGRGSLGSARLLQPMLNAVLQWEGSRVHGTGCRIRPGCRVFWAGCRTHQGYRVFWVGYRTHEGCRVFGVGCRIHEVCRVFGVGFRTLEWGSGPLKGAGFLG